jgi:hypothetical protein
MFLNFGLLGQFRSAQRLISGTLGSEFLQNPYLNIKQGAGVGVGGGGQTLALYSSLASLHSGIPGTFLQLSGTFVSEQYA